MQELLDQIEQKKLEIRDVDVETKRAGQSVESLKAEYGMIEREVLDAKKEADARDPAVVEKFKWYEATTKAMEEFTGVRVEKYSDTAITFSYTPEGAGDFSYSVDLELRGPRIQRIEVSHGYNYTFEDLLAFSETITLPLPNVVQEIVFRLDAYHGRQREFQDLQSQ